MHFSVFSIGCARCAKLQRDEIHCMVALPALNCNALKRDPPTTNKNRYTILNNRTVKVTVCTSTMMTELHRCIGVFIYLVRRD